MCEQEGCSKAFSNASDRAKHQNRTHSNEVRAQTETPSLSVPPCKEPLSPGLTPHMRACILLQKAQV